MTVEAMIYAALRGLVGDRVYPDYAPENTPRPYITYQQIGGASINFLDATNPSKANSRMQISVWADTRALASATVASIEETMRALEALQTEVLGQPMALNDPITKLRGFAQDFSFWN